MKKMILCLVLLLIGCQEAEFSEINNIQGNPVDEVKPIEEEQAIESIDRLIADLDLTNLKSISVLKNGNVEFEAYYHGATEHYLNNVFSVTKSVTSLLTGIAVEEGYLQVEDYISDYIDFEFYNLSSDYEKVRVEELLTMSSGIIIDDNTSNEYRAIKNASDPLKVIFENDLRFSPGSRFQYSDATAYVMGAVLQEALGTTLETYADEKLFGPLEIDSYKWYQSNSGVNYPGFDLYLTCQAMQKIGQLVLDEGYLDHQIVSGSWLEQATATYQKTYSSAFHKDYGYYWWLGDVEGYQVISALGHGGQYITIVPDLDLVITAACYGAVNDELAGRQSSILKDLIVEGIIPYYIGEGK